MATQQQSRSFDAKTHTYILGQSVVPSVTQIMKSVFGQPWEASEYYMQRGSVIHAFAAMIARKQEFFDCDVRIAGHIAAIRKFFTEFQPVILPYGIETALFSDQYRFAGTPDLLMYLGKTKVILDYKSSFSGLEPIQLGGYSILTGITDGLAVELHDDGTYKLSEVWKLKKWQNRFLAALTICNTKRELGIKEEKEV